MLFGNFTLSNYIILVKDLVRWKRSFEIFSIHEYAGDIESKNITGKYIKKSLYQCHPPYSYTRLVSSHSALYLKFLTTYNICAIHLHLIVVCLKVVIAMFYFCHSQNPSDVMENLFNTHSLNPWKTKQTSYKKINLYFLDIMKNGHTVEPLIAAIFGDQA